MSVRFRIPQGDRSGKFSYRAAALILDPARDRILIHQCAGDSYWSLPGGAVHYGEETADALRRELIEEIGAPVQVERLLWIAETFFHQPDGFVSEHELAFYYLCALPPDHPYLTRTTFEGVEDETGEARRLVFRWADRRSATVAPGLLRDRLAQPLPASPAHVIHHQSEDASG